MAEQAVQTPTERLRLARKLAGMTQEDAARALDVTVRTYARWERGETQGWLSEVPRIAEVLGVSADDLAPPSPQLDDSRLARMEAQLGEMREMLEQLVSKRRG